MMSIISFQMVYPNKCVCVLIFYLCIYLFIHIYVYGEKGSKCGRILIGWVNLGESA